ncbi:MAG TPA: endolytic transglycosylase MltG [Prolixibacteraceae bacterium]
MNPREKFVAAFLKIWVKVKLSLVAAMAAIRKIEARSKPNLSLALKKISRIAGRINRDILLIINTLRRVSLKKKLIFLTSILLLLSFLTVKHVHTIYYWPNVVRNYHLFIRDGENFESVVKLLKENKCLENLKTFKEVARMKDYDVNIRPGAYVLETGWSNSKLVNLLRSGAQTPVMVTFNNVRTKEELAGKLARQLQSDSLSFLTVFRNDSNTLKLGFKPETLPALFIPNTYSIYWTTTPMGFLTRMKREYDQFWNEARRQKAKSLGLSTEQVATLASIVQEESNKNDEKPVIAGVYLNRLKKNWPLQADPTIRFVLGDYSIHRILTEQLSVESPYNTYKNVGLPPGPINIPEISSLEAILNYQVHDFFYFCAKEDFSGYHNFARTLFEHNNNARKYQAALNKKKVFK